MSEKDSIEAVQEILGNPIAASFSDNALKIRRNLLVCSIAVGLATLGAVSVDPEASVFGLKFRGLTNDLIRDGLLVVTTYLLLHFAWYTLEALAEWRLRVTGTRLAFLTGSRLGSFHCDYPSDPKQSTLYSWWQEQAKKIGNITLFINNLEGLRRDTDAAVKSLISSGGNQTNLNNVLQSLSQLQNSVEDLSRKVDCARHAVEAQRVPVSLKRFDEWFSMFLRSQNLRWLLIEVCLPLTAGAVALWLLLR